MSKKNFFYFEQITISDSMGTSLVSQNDTYYLFTFFVEINFAIFLKLIYTILSEANSFIYIFFFFVDNFSYRNKCSKLYK